MTDDLLNAGPDCTCGQCVGNRADDERRREALERARMSKDTTEGLLGRQISAVKRKSGITGRREGAA